MPDKTRMRDEHSCGGVVVSFREGAPFVAMIATRQKTRWGLPKGAVSDGETPEQAALREVQEETGLEAKIVKKLDTIEYFFRAGGTLIRKRVDFFLMLYVAGELTPQLSEVDDTAWFDLQEAIGRASFDSERKLLERTAEEVATLTQQAGAEENQRVAR
ncbi:MAG TPA: NUDIX hydrolase [Thermoanaerobaculia bacterium]|nr:NUDIX hydrolase [Thermoanaerobaculia bacterium]